MNGTTINDVPPYQADWESHSSTSYQSPSDYVEWYKNIDTSNMTPQQQAQYEESIRLLNSSSPADRIKGLEMMMELSYDLGILDPEGGNMMTTLLQDHISAAKGYLKTLEQAPSGESGSETYWHAAGAMSHHMSVLGVYEGSSLQTAMNKVPDPSAPNSAQLLHIEYKIAELNQQIADADPNSKKVVQLEKQLKSFEALRDYYTQPLANEEKYWAETADIDNQNYQGYDAAAWSSQAQYYQSAAEARRAYLEEKGASPEEIANDPYLNYFTVQASHALEAYAKSAISEFMAANPNATSQDVRDFINSDPNLKAAVDAVVATGRMSFNEFVVEAPTFFGPSITFEYLSNSYKAQTLLYTDLASYHTEMSGIANGDEKKTHLNAAAEYQTKAATSQTKLQRIFDIAMSFLSNIK